MNLIPSNLRPHPGATLLHALRAAFAARLCAARLTLCLIAIAAAPVTGQAADILYFDGIVPTGIGKLTPPGPRQTLPFSDGVGGLVSDGAGGVYAASFEDGKIRRITQVEVVSDFATVVFPHDLTRDGAGNLYCVSGAFLDLQTSLVKITPSGAVITLATFSYGMDVDGLTSDSSGNLYFVQGQQIKKRSTNGVITTVHQPTLDPFTYAAGGICLDAAGKIAFASGNRIYKVLPDGTQFTHFATLPGTNVQIAGMALDSEGNLYAANIAGSAIFKITPSAQVSEAPTGDLFAPARVAASAPAAVPGAEDPSFAVSNAPLPPFREKFGKAGAAVQPDGKVVTTGWFPTRFRTDGTLDPTFSPAGRAESVVVLPDGKLLLGDAGSLRRVNADGTPDPAFSCTVPNLFAPGPFGSLDVAITVQKDGRLLVIAGGNVVRLNADGSLNGTFALADFEAKGVTLQDDGKILAWGYVISSSGSRQRVVRLETNGTPDVTFFPPTLTAGSGLQIRVVAVQGDRKILVAGSFAAVNDTPRVNLARLHQNGTLDAGFVSNLERLLPLDSMVLQVDGKILIGASIEGGIVISNGVQRRGLVRLTSTGALDVPFNAPGEGAAAAPVIQADGKVVYIRAITVSRGEITRLQRIFNDPAPQALLTSPDLTSVAWQRGGSAPETQQVTFEVSTNNGNTWTLLGFGTRATGGWQLGGLTMPSSGLLRARARVVSGKFGGSSGLVEQVIGFVRGGINRPPLAIADSFNVPSQNVVELDVLANDSDPDLDPLTISAVTNIVGGSAVRSAGNTRVTFTPNGAVNAGFDYTISDGRGGTASAHVTIITSQIVPLVLGRPPGSYAAFTLGGGLAVVETVSGNTAIDGDTGVAVGSGLTLSGPARLAGDLYLRLGGTLSVTPPAVVTGATFQNTATDALLNQGVADAQAAAAAAAALEASPGMPTVINGPTNLSGSGTVVINLTDLILSGGAHLTLTGDASTKFIINVSGTCTFRGGVVALAGGIPVRNVLINVVGPGPEVGLITGAQVNATMLAVERTLNLSSASTVTGGVAARKVGLTGGSRVQRAP